MWINYFSKILLINLPHRTERLEASVDELLKHGIPFEIVPAIQDSESGARGLHKTLFTILERAKLEDWDNVLILEDDCVFEHENFNDYMNAAIHELKYLEWDLFYLGGNVFKSLTRVPKCDYLLRTDGTCSTHALAYSKQGWKLMLEEMRRIKAANVVDVEAIDLTLTRVIQPRGKSYIANPLLCTQRPGWSDVEQRDTDYKNLIQERYEQRLKEIEG